MEIFLSLQRICRRGTGEQTQRREEDYALIAEKKHEQKINIA
jgi:hypothetical protein